jgi:CubicO group peptidase (beta-lactamase class C family)
MRAAVAWSLAGALSVALIWVAPASAESVDAFGTALKTWAAREKITHAEVVVRHGGNVIYRFALGGVDPSQPVQLASLSKAITGACVATLVRDGRLGFDTPLSAALAKFFAVNGQPADPQMLAITIGELLTHRSGLPGIASGGDPGTGQPLVAFLAHHRASDAPTAAFYATVFKTKLTHSPGTIYDYSNAGFLALGAVIEEATGKPYATYCSDAVLKPLGITGSLDPRWALIAPYAGWRLSPENYLRLTDVFDPANPFLGKAVQAFLFTPTSAAANAPGASWYALGTNIRSSGSGYITAHWGEWRYDVASKTDPMSVDVTTFVTRVPDGTAWFVYFTPAVGDAAHDALDHALFSAYQSVTTWP